MTSFSATNPTYRGEIITGTLPGTTLVFNNPNDANAPKVSIEGRDASGAFHLQLIQAVDRDVRRNTCYTK